MDQGHLAAARAEPAATATASATDLATARLGSTEAKRKAALRRVKLRGEPDAIEELRPVFSLLEILKLR